jgi:exo-1,4-beta-D-glucosaminidase
VLPIVWNDNDITLWPGESESMTSTYSSTGLRGQPTVVTVSGWNVPLETVASR